MNCDGDEVVPPLPDSLRVAPTETDFFTHDDYILALGTWEFDRDLRQDIMRRRNNVQKRNRYRHRNEVQRLSHNAAQSRTAGRRGEAQRLFHNAACLPANR